MVLAAVTRAADAPPPIPLRVADGPVVAQLQATPNPNKPYIAQLFAPGEKPLPLLDDSPPDHFHHHGLMFAIAVDGTDFWSEKGIPNTGRQEPVVDPGVARDSDGFNQRLCWLATDGTRLLDETRRVKVRVTGKGDDTVHWLDWQSTLTPAAGRESVRLTGSHYFGLGMRFLPAWDRKAEWIWPDVTGQKVVRGDERLTRGPWCAVRCVIDGQPITLLMVDHSANPRPALWFTMREPFCYLSATLNLAAEPATLKTGESWTLRYGIAVMNGKPDYIALSKLAANWKKALTTKTTEPHEPPNR